MVTSLLESFLSLRIETPSESFKVREKTTNAILSSTYFIHRITQSVTPNNMKY